MERIDELFMSSEQLSDEFILGLQQRTTGIHSQNLRLEANHLKIVDVGGTRSERKKWMVEACTSATRVVFVVSLAGYCETLFEDETAVCD